MDPRFKAIDQDTVIPAPAGPAGFNANVTAPWNQIFKIVFFPDRIYHAQYLNATRSPRYQYNVMEVRGRADFTVLKTEVYLDSKFLCNALRIEYRAGRLAEQVRERGRLLRNEVMAWVELTHKNPALGENLKRYVKMFYDRYVNAYQVEIWETLEPPETESHSFKVLDQMGLHKPITAIPGFRSALKDIHGITGVDVSFRETDLDRPFNYRINNTGWDNDYARSHQEPKQPSPNSPDNTVLDQNYRVDFQRGWVKDVNEVPPVFYQNAMMEPSSADYFRGPLPNPGVFDGTKNVMGMRWIIQRELGGTIVYFHQVELPPGAVEGTHQHIGSEELYYFIEGEGIAYIGDGDDPHVDATYPLVNPMPDIYGLGPKPCRQIPVKPGITLFTKSGGIHGVRNPSGNPGPLKFVAFGYHSS
ncbi:cupin domain-containing protein [Bradyrhizobium australafricanum]|uniref:cupin domain-containing protein n=1 Tax=Bradyrhizobium australafricanum TaxID=2821406 RepID=UPI001CE2C8D3|nr:cupin domain-containing protein [Bradyrhizobium australafricanum]